MVLFKGKQIFQKKHWDLYVWLLGVLLFMLSGCGDGDNTKKTSSLNDEENEKIWNPSLVYGSDDRKEFYQVSTELQNISDSTVVLMKAATLKSEANARFSFQSGSLQSDMGVCSSEPFAQQPTAGFCSGTLVTKDIVLTAGHCLRDAVDCRDVRFVFGFALKSAGVNPQSVAQSEVYGCREILKTVVESSGADFAIIRLDREVIGHRPAPMRRSGVVVSGDSIVVMGHPVGLPLKIAGGAKVRSVQASHFVANLDTYGGNSGSGVFNAATGMIEGVLVRGDTDFVNQGSCRVSNRCADEACRGEDVTRIDKVLAQFPVSEIPNSGGTTPPVDNTPVLADQEFTVSPNTLIPDNSSTGIVSVLNVTTKPQGRKVEVVVDISHSYRGDLVLSLVSPDGREILLQNRKGGNAQNLIGTFGKELGAEALLAPLSTLAISGAWKLKVSDRARIDTGRLKKWTLRFKKI